MSIAKSIATTIGGTVGGPVVKTSGGVTPPPGYRFLLDSDGAYLLDSDGAYLVELI